MSETLPPTVPEVPNENNVIREMRAAIDAAKAEAKANADRAIAAEAKIQEAERAKLDEIERVKLEKADLEKRIESLAPLEARMQTFEQQAQARYDAELAAIPEDKRTAIEALTKNGTPFERLSALEAARALLPAPQAASTNGRPSPTAPGVTPPTYQFDPSNPYAGAFGRKA